jgi:hypothetical protein
MSAVVLTISSRMGLQNNIAFQRERYIALHARRLDLANLKSQLLDLTASGRLATSVVLVDNEKEALPALQRSVRRRVESVKAELLSLTESNSNKASSILGLQIRARIPESSLPILLSAFELGDPKLVLADLTLVTKTTGTNEAFVELTAGVRGRWLVRSEVSP